MAASKEWLEHVFKSGMEQIKNKRHMPNSRLPENMLHMISMLDEVVDRADQDKVSRLIARSIADLDAEMIGRILFQDIGHYFQGKLLPDILAQLEAGQIDRVMDIMSEELKSSPSRPGSDREKVLHRILAAREKKRGKGIFGGQQEIPSPGAGQERGGLDVSRKDSPAVFVDAPDLSGPPETMESLCERLAKELLSERQDIRDQASAEFASVSEGLPKQEQQVFVERLAPTLMRWIQLETASTAAHKRISSLLKDHMLRLVQEHRYAECLPLVNAFHLIDQGLLEKNEDIKNTSSEVINELSRWYRLEALFEAYGKSSDHDRMDIGRILARLGNASLNRLMDMLRDNPDSDERVRILHLIKEVGPAAISVITERSAKDFPWHHHRNLAYLLRFIKSRETVDVLRTLLKNKHQKVREEALESLNLVGADERGPVLLSLLPTVDDAFKMSIIDMLGKIRYKEAAAALIGMLKDRPLMKSSAREDMEEALCIALGKIGTAEAASLLTEISRQKFYSITSYPGRVRKAAARALLSINPQER